MMIRRTKMMISRIMMVISIMIKMMISRMIKMMDDDDYDAFHNDPHLGNNVWTVVLQL